jgi:predicted dehydrogenase
LTIPLSMTTPTLIPVGLFGTNGHQVHRHLLENPLARLAACAGFSQPPLPDEHPHRPALRVYKTFDELLGDPDIQLVVLCSPIRAEQPAHALAALRAGKHVFAEKPCALDENDLDRLLAEAASRGLVFREMADSAYSKPYAAMRRIVQSGALGEIVQIACQKSYPWRDSRPQDESTDGGLVRQCALHAARWIEHVAGRRIASIHPLETRLGNPDPNGQSRIAACLAMTLDNGGLASITANYLNPKGTGLHGYESLVIHGTLGLVESLRGGTLTRLVVGSTDHGPIDSSAPEKSQFQHLLEHLALGSPMPIPLAEELSPTRWMIRAKKILDAPAW